MKRDRAREMWKRGGVVEAKKIKNKNKNQQQERGASFNNSSAFAARFYSAVGLAAGRDRMVSRSEGHSGPWRNALFGTTAATKGIAEM